MATEIIGDNPSSCNAEIGHYEHAMGDFEDFYYTDTGSSLYVFYGEYTGLYTSL